MGPQREQRVHDDNQFSIVITGSMMVHANKRKKNNKAQKQKNLRGKFRFGHFVSQVPAEFPVDIQWSGRYKSLKFLVHSFISRQSQS